MPQFCFRAVDAKGRMTEGEIDASDQAAVVEQLRQSQKIPLAVQLKGKSQKGKSRSRLIQSLSSPLWGSGMRKRDVAVMTRELSVLLNAGLTVDKALSFLIEVSSNENQRRLIANLLEKVQSGCTLADALEDYSAVFSPIYVGLVRAGEAGNTLNDVLTRIAHFLDRNEQLTDQFKSALVYPILLMVMAAISIVVLLALVVPQFTPLFESAGAKLPMLTQAVVSLAKATMNYWWLGLILLASFILWVKVQFRNPVRRAQLDHIALKLPLIGNLIAKIDTAKLARTVGTLLTNGVALPHALSIAKETMSNASLRSQLDATLQAVKEGKLIADSLERAGAFPKLATHLIAVGERSGQLETMMLKVSEILDQDVKTTIERLMALLVPVLTIGIGMIIATIIGAILTAILQAYQLPI